MALTPDKVDLRTDDRGRYYHATREREVQKYNTSLSRCGVYLWVCYFGDKREPYEAEEDVLAPSKSEASAVMRAALKRDFDPRVTLTEVKLA
jgi:hypothetical protein